MQEKYESLQISRYLLKKGAKNRIPIEGTFELTPVCNMSCKMCYVRKTMSEVNQEGRLLTAEEWISIAEAAQKQGMIYVLLTGGEPFLRTDLNVILKGLHGLGLLVSINTNGTLIDESVIKWLMKYPPARVNITLYGSSDDTYKKLCNNPYGFTQVSKAIDLLMKNNISVKLNCSLTPQNKDDLRGIIKFASVRNLPLQISTYMFPPLRRDHKSYGKNNRFTPEEAAYQNAQIIKYKYGQDILGRYLDEIPVGLKILENYLSEETPEIIPKKMGCFAAKSSFWVNWKGDLTMCGMIPGKANKLLNKEFMTAWKTVVDEADQILLPKTCSNCPAFEICRPCPANAVTETGNFNSVPKYKCQMTRSLISQYKKAFEE